MPTESLRLKNFRSNISYYKRKEALLKSRKEIGSRSSSLKTRRTKLAAMKPANPYRALRIARGRLPPIPRALKGAPIQKQLYGEQGLAAWRRARRAYNAVMSARIYGHPRAYLYDLDKLSDEEDTYDEDQWTIDQQDPDNWVIIPEFNVAPQAVSFEGFRTPIVYPDVPDAEAANNIRALLTVGRNRIRAIFTNRRDMLEKAIEAMELEVEDWDSLHRPALAYFLLERSIEEAVNFQRSPELRVGQVASAASTLAAWLSDDTAALAKLAGLRTRASEGGRRSGEVRKRTSISHEEVVEAAMALGWPKVSWGVNKAVAKQFDVTANYIGEILSKWKTSG